MVNPATGGVIATVGSGSASDVDAAVGASRAAFEAGEWPGLSGAERAHRLLRLADLVERDIDEVSLIECMDGGNPVKMLRAVDISKSIAEIRDNAGWASRITGVVPMTPAKMEGLSYSAREPVGVVGIITPWNAPFLMAVKKLSAALAAGCTCVIKPAELAPLSAIRLVELVAEAGFPDGVVNLVTGTGSEAGQALVDHSDVDMISFTGSTAVGRTILRGAADSNLKRTVLELGGKSAVIVLADADIDRAAKSVAKEIVFKSGQYCAAGTRLFVEKKCYDAFVEQVVAHLRHVEVGDGRLASTEMGPLISERQLERVEGYVLSAARDGARIACGGSRLSRPGSFFAPTLVDGTTSAMRIVREEVFGPVLCAEAVEASGDVDKFAERANDSEYGLAAKIWSNDLARVHKLARRLRVGSVLVNGGGGEGPLPAGGFKQSGIGREGGREGVEAFTEMKSIRMAF